MSRKDFIRTAIALRAREEMSFAETVETADVIDVPGIEEGEDGEPVLVTGRVAVWSHRGRLKGELLTVAR